MIFNQPKIEMTKDPIHPVGKNGITSMGRTPYMNTPQRGISSQTNTWASFMYPATVYEQHSTMGSAPQMLTGVIPKENLQNMDPASWKLTGKENTQLHIKWMHAHGS